MEVVGVVWLEEKDSEFLVRGKTEQEPLASEIVEFQEQNVWGRDHPIF